MAKTKVNEDVAKLSGMTSNGKFGIPDIAGKTMSAKIEMARRGYSVPLPEGARIIANSPKGDFSQYNKYLTAQTTAQEKHWRDIFEKAQKLQQNRLENMANMTAGERADYMREQENRRLGLPGKGVDSNTAEVNARERNMQLDWAKDYLSGGKAYHEEMREQSMLSPADKIIAQENIQNSLDAATYMMFNMASLKLKTEGTPEEYAFLQQHLAAWLELKGTDALAFDPWSMFSAIAFDDIMPTDLGTLVGIGALHVGDTLTKEQALQYSFNIPDNMTMTVVRDEKGKPFLKVGGAQNVFGMINEIREGGTQFYAGEVGENEEIVVGDKYRIRNFATPQALTPEMAATYFTSDEATAYFKTLSEGAIVVAGDVYEDGKWETHILYTVTDGWKIYADGSREDPDGIAYTPEEFKVYVDKLKAEDEASIAEYNNSKVGLVVNDALSKNPRSAWQRRFFTIQDENGNTLVRAGYPTTLYQGMLGTDAKVETIDGRDYVSIYNEQEEWEQYTLPLAYDDNNLPSFISKQPTGVGDQFAYFINTSTKEGVIHLSRYYPDTFFEMIHAGGETDIADSFLHDELHWSNDDIAAFFKNRSGDMIYTASTINSVPWWAIGTRAEYGMQQIGSLINGVREVPIVGDFFATGAEGVLTGVNAFFITTPDFLADVAVDIPDFVNGLSASDKAFYGDLADKFKQHGPLAFFDAETQQVISTKADVPKWLYLGFETAAMLVPVAGMAGKISKMRMPLMLRPVRTGLFSYVKNISKWSDLEAAATFNGWKVMKTGIKDRMMMVADGKTITFKSFKEADNFFKTGSKELNDIGLSVSIAGAKKVELSNGVAINILDNKPAREILDYLAVNHPGRLGGGFINFIKAKGYKLTNGKISDVTRPTELASTEQVMALTREAIETGAISLDQIFRSVNQIRLWGSSNAAGIAQHYLAQLEANFGDIAKMLPVKDNVITKGVKALEGAPLVDGKASLAWNDVFQYYKYYEFENPNALAWIESAHRIINGVVEQGEKHGVVIEKKILFDMFELAEYFPRGGVIGKADAKFKIFRGGAKFPKGKMSAEKQRTYEFMQDSINDGYMYDTPKNIFGSYIDQMYVSMANHDAMDLWVKADLARVAGSETEMGATLIKGAKVATKDVINVQKLVNEIKLMQKYTNYSPEPNVWKMIKREYPEYYSRLKKLRKPAPKVEAKPVEAAVPKIEAATAKYPWDMSIEELGFQKQVIIERDKILLAKYGEDYNTVRKAYIRGDSKVINRVEDALSEEDYKIFTEGISTEGYDDFISAINEVQVKTLAELVPVLKYDVTKLPQNSNVASWTTSEQIAYTKFKKAFQLAKERGWDTKELSDKVFGASAQRFGTEAEFMLSGLKIPEVKPMEPITSAPEAARAITPVIETSDAIVADAFDKILLDAQNLLNEKAGIKKENIKQRASAAEAFRHIGFTETTGNRVGLRGEIYDDVVINGQRFTGKQIMDKWEKTMGKKPNPILRVASDINRNLVMLQTVDLLSAAFIQGIHLLGIDTRNNLRALLGQGKPSFIWGEAVYYSLAHEVTPKTMNWFHRHEAATYDFAINEGLVMEAAGGEYFTRGTFLEKGLKKIPILGTVPIKIMDIAGRGFGAYGEAGRVLTIKNLKREWLRSGGTGAELVEFANNITGVTSSKMMGVGASQRMAESAGLFASRYLRSNLMVINRMMPLGSRFGGAKRGMTGKMLYETVAGTMAGWTASYVALCLAMGQTPRLKPWPESIGDGEWKGDGSKAFTIKVGDQYVGVLGGFTFSWMKTWAGIAAQAYDNPDKFFTIDFSSLSTADQSLAQNNPLYRFMTGKSAPGLSLVREMVTGRDYLGYSLEGNDYLVEIANNFMPFVLQSVTTQTPSAGIKGFAVGMFGLRNFPETMWERFYDDFEELVANVPDSALSPEQIVKRDNGTLGWGDLTKWQKETYLANNPALKESYDIAKEAENERRSEQEKAWDEEILNNEKTRKDKNDADFILLQDLNDTEIVTIVDYRKHLSDNSNDFYAVSDDIKRRYPDLYASFEKAWADKSETAPQFDIAYNEFYDIMFNEKYVLAGGTPDYKAIDAAIADWVEKWDKDGNTGFLGMIQDLKRYGFAGQNPLELKLWEDKETFTPYYDLPQGKAREAYLKNEANTDVAARLAFWGFVSTMTPEVEAIVKEWCKEYNVPEKTIPALMADMIPDAAMPAYGIKDASLQKKYNDIPLAGHDRERFLIEHPDFSAYYYGAAPNGLGHATTDKEGKSLIPTWENTPTVDQEKLIAQFEALNTGKTDEGKRAQNIWRCKNREGEQVLIKFGSVSTPLTTKYCETLLAKTSESGMSVNPAPVKSEKEAIKREQ